MKVMAKKAPDGSKVESRSKRFTRYVQHEQVDSQTYYIPFLEPLLAGLAQGRPWVLVMDSSEVGWNCLALVIRNSKGSRIELSIISDSTTGSSSRTHQSYCESGRNIISGLSLKSHAEKL